MPQLTAFERKRRRKVSSAAMSSFSYKTTLAAVFSRQCAAKIIFCTLFSFLCLPTAIFQPECEQRTHRVYPYRKQKKCRIADAAARYFREHGITRLPARKALQDEIEQLVSEKDGLYNGYREQKRRFAELQTVKRNIDQILRREEPHRRKEQNHER